MFVTGHVHRQDVLEQWDWRNQFKPTVTIITGGGGGITSEFWPDPNGNDDQYGFVDATLWKDKVKVQMVSHGGQVRKTHVFTKRDAQYKPKEMKKYFSIKEEDEAWEKVHKQKEEAKKKAEAEKKAEEAKKAAEKKAEEEKKDKKDKDKDVSV
eukprot:Skav229282  [mRNA]  locus=scaffold952:390040:392660:- [translate_table: standard]